MQLFATFAAYLPPGATGGSAVLDVAPDTTAGDLPRLLGIPEDASHILLVNGVDAGPEQRLRDGDVASLFPPLAGGSESSLRWRPPT